MRPSWLIFVVLDCGGLAGCWFNADYTPGKVACRDGQCPSGLACIAEVCVIGTLADGMTAGSDAASHDARPDTSTPAELTCSDPGAFIADTTVTGSTAARSNTVSASCNGTVMNGHDAVYKIAGTLGHQLTLTPHSAAYPVTAYAIAPCTVAPATPTCVGNGYATDTTPFTITLPATTDYYIIVDGGNPSPTASGAYSLTIAVN